MSYNFLPYEQEQLYLMPPSVQEWVGEGSLARFLSEVVDGLAEQGRLESFYAHYRADGWGAAAYHPVMMVKVLLYGYSTGVVSSRKISQALEQEIGFRYLAANQTPDFRTVNTFRTAHLEALQGLFTEVLELCREAGLVKMGRVALDGTKVKGNCALERNRTREQLEKAVRELLEAAETTDREEDAQYGLEVRGDELPEGLRTTEERKRKIEAALKSLDERRDAVRTKQQEKVDAREKRGGIKRGRQPKEPKSMDLPKTATGNLTDADSRALSARGGWVQGYNGQAMADCSSQVIVAQQITQDHNDLHQLVPMMKRCQEQAGSVPEVLVADGGYWSDENSAAGGEETLLLIALPKRPKTAKSPPSAQRQAMEERLKEEANQEAYAQRKSTIEPVFGQMRTRGMRNFGLRGKVKAALEWSLWCTTHNLLKLWRAHTRPVAAAPA
jgi:transposase